MTNYFTLTNEVEPSTNESEPLILTNEIKKEKNPAT